jgi:dihydropyrimidinase
MSGLAQVVATDHCAFTTEQKRYGRRRFHQDPQRHRGAGGPDADALDPRGRTGRLTPNEFVAVTSTNIAKILNCYPKKGAILVGADADIVVWDPEKRPRRSPPARSSPAIDYNVFEGKEVTGLPRFTLTRGQVAVHDGEIRTQEGHGKFVAREPNGTVNKALSTWKELTAPTPVERTGIPATGV